jgi:hypothetical protein
VNPQGVVRDVAPLLERCAGDPVYAPEACLEAHGAEALDRLRHHLRVQGGVLYLLARECRGAPIAHQLLFAYLALELAFDRRLQAVRELLALRRLLARVVEPAT